MSNKIQNLAVNKQKLLKNIEMINQEIQEVALDQDVDGQISYIDLLNKREQLLDRVYSIDQAMEHSQQSKSRRSANTIRSGTRVRMKTGESLVEVRLVDKVLNGIAERLITVDSPLGQALLGRSRGEAVQVSTPGGAREYEIVAIYS